jgi:cysteine desulfurase/selenocysteine lyase
MTTAAVAFDVEKIRRDFPILRQKINGNPLVYLDNAASTQKPLAVIDAIRDLYTSDYANIHRGVHELSQRATQRYEDSRAAIQRFIHAADSREIIFVRGATEGINLVAGTWGRRNVGPGDEIVLSALEHHSNIVPWQLLAEEKGARIRVAPINDEGELLLDEFEKLLNPRTRLVAVNHISNALGTINPIARMTELAHAHGAVVLVDGAQAVPHMRVDVGASGCDFYTFSGHKMYGPTGIGVLWGRLDLLEEMPPYQGGGDMISSVTFERTTYNSLPWKFEAGTPNIEGSIGLAAAVDYLDELGIENVEAYEAGLLAYGTARLSEIPGLRILGTAREKAAVLSFVLDGVHPHDVGTILDRYGIAVRTGHHCAQPLMDRFGVPATTRASLAFYNTRDEIDSLVAGMEKVKEIFR